MTDYEFSLTESISLSRALDPLESFALTDEGYLLVEYIFGLTGQRFHALTLSANGVGTSELFILPIKILNVLSSGVGSASLSILPIKILELTSSGVGLSLIDMFKESFMIYSSSGVGSYDLVLTQVIRPFRTSIGLMVARSYMNGNFYVNVLASGLNITTSMFKYIFILPLKQKVLKGRITKESVYDINWEGK